MSSSGLWEALLRLASPILALGLVGDLDGLLVGQRPLLAEDAQDVLGVVVGLLAKMRVLGISCGRGRSR
jgi:hypothetical protein